MNDQTDVRGMKGLRRTIDSASRTLDFDSGPVLTVYEGDRLAVTVVDDDVLEDYLIGRHSLAVTRQILERGPSIVFRSRGVVQRCQVHNDGIIPA